MTITDSKTNSKTLILLTNANLSPEDITIQVNNGVYDHKTDYTDARFKENYVMTSDGGIGFGYDCLVRNKKGEAVAWVEAHYCDGWSDPFRVKIYGMKADITHEEYVTLKKGLGDRIAELNRMIDGINANQKGFESNNDPSANAQNRSTTDLSRKLLIELIDKIYVHENNHIKIVTKFKGME